jgi:hypothetical protein
MPTTMIKPIKARVRKNENKNAWFMPGHFRMSIASMLSGGPFLANS